MKIVYVQTLKSGKLQFLVELQHDDEQLMLFRPNQYYKMGDPTEDIVSGRQPFAKRMRAAIEASHGIKETTE